MTEKEIETKSGSIQGRAEALQIILNIEPEEGLEEYMTSSPVGITGEYDCGWDVDKLKKLFNVGNEYEDSPLGKLVKAADLMYWEEVIKEQNHDSFKDLVRRLINQIEKGDISKDRFSPLGILKGWVKEKGG